MIDMWERIADKHDIILIAPTAIDGIWTKSDTTAFFDKIITEVDKGYKIDRSRLYLFVMWLHYSGQKIYKSLNRRNNEQCHQENISSIRQNSGNHRLG